jgi:hypothetical protein
LWQVWLLHVYTLFVRFNTSAMGHHEITQMLPTLCGPLKCPYIDLHVSFSCPYWLVSLASFPASFE